MACDRLVVEYLFCLDRKGLSDCKGNVGLIDLDGLRVAVFTAGRGGVRHLGLRQPYLFAVYQLIGFGVILVVGATGQVFVGPSGVPGNNDVSVMPVHFMPPVFVFSVL